MELWDSSQVKAFLVSKDASETIVKAVEKANTNGKLLKMIGQQNMETELPFMQAVLGLSQTDLENLNRIVKIYLADNEDPSSARQHQPLFSCQKSRQFGSEVGDTIYSMGACLSAECSSSDLSPAREYKSGQNVSPSDFEKFFIERLAKFACACINRRCNGTIYFGVGDNKETEPDSSKSKYRHGQILGIELEQDFDNGHVNGWIDSHFRATKPKLAKRFTLKQPEVAEIRNCFSSCLKSTLLIPIRNSNKVVIEVDIEPNDIFCKYLMVYYIGYDNKKHYFLRDGESSVEYTHMLEKLSPMVRQNSDRRYTLDHNEDCRSDDANVKLSRLLSRNQLYLDDCQFKYVFLCNRSRPQLNEKISKWLVLINWISVWSFDATYNNEDSLFNSLKSARDFMRQFDVIFPTSNEKYDDKIWKTSRLKWIQCTLQREEKQSWFLQERNALQSICNDLVNSQDKRDFVFVLGLFGTDNLVEMSDIFIELCTKVQNNDQACIVYTERDVFSAFTVEVRNKLSNIDLNSIHFKDWEDLETFLLSKKSSEHSNTELQVPNSNGIPKEVKKEVIEAYKHSGMEILGINHCKTSELENSKLLAFLRGGGPTWEVFHCNDFASEMPDDIINPLVERSLTQMIKKQIEGNAGKNVLTKLFKFVHHPGSGATTIAMHVLWKLRQSYRCIMIENLDANNIAYVAEKIFAFYFLDEREDDGTLCKVLILLDNSSDEKALALKKEIECRSSINKIKYRKNLFTILYLTRQSVFSQTPVSKDSEGIVVGEPPFTLKQEDLKGEIEKFKKKLNALTKDLKSKEIPMENMLAFVIMAENFDQKSKYVKKIVDDALLEIELYGKQKDLLVYLAIMKYYGDRGFPSSNCHSFIDVLGYANIKNTTTLIETLGNPTKFFVVEKITSESYKALEISHAPVAYQLLEKFLSFSSNKSKLCDKMTELLKEEKFIGKRFQKLTIHEDIREVLVKRNTLEDGITRPLFSKLIEDIKRESTDMALKLLKFAFKQLDESKKPYIAQTLSRLFTRTNQFEDAETWATTAIELDELYTFYDTRGQVYKVQLAKMLEGGDQSKVDVTEAIEISRKAADNFQTAERIFKEQRKSREMAFKNDLFSSDLNINAALYGEIEVNTRILTLLLDQLKSEAKKHFLESLTQENKIDLRISFPKVEFSNKMLSFISSLYKRTNSCINKATNLMNYFESSGFEDTLFKWVKKYDEIIETENPKWMVLSSTNQNICQLKIPVLLKYIRSTTNTSFTFLLQKLPQRTLEEKLRIMELIHGQLGESPATCFMNQDKLSYIRLAVVKLLRHLYPSHHFTQTDSMSPETFENLEKRAISYSKELANDGFQNVEPYLFYVLLTWPFPDDSGNKKMIVSPDFEEDIFKMCIEQLRQFEKDIWKGYWDEEICSQAKKPQVPFFLKNKSRESLDSGSHFGIRRLYMKRWAVKSWEIKNLFKAKGFLTESNCVTYSLPSGDEIKMRKAYLGKEETNFNFDGSSCHLHRVTYNVGFTFGGPVAYFVEDQQDSIRDQVRKKQLEQPKC